VLTFVRNYETMPLMTPRPMADRRRCRQDAGTLGLVHGAGWLAAGFEIRGL